MTIRKDHKRAHSGWDPVEADSMIIDSPEDAYPGPKKKTKRPKKEEKPRTHWLGDELDKSELLLKRPIRKADVIGGRKMVFYQYRPDLYNPQGTNFAGRRKSERTSAYRGVYWNKNHKKWEIKIKIGGKTLSLGFDSSEESAARKYDRFITKFVINRLAVNFPEDMGGVKLSIKDLVTEEHESIEEANEKVKKRVHAKVQDIAMDFGLDSPEEVASGCLEWPTDPSQKGDRHGDASNSG